jgi:MFS transporter, DHA1 family, inner membrane transport protein
LCGTTAVLMLLLFPRVTPTSAGSLRSQAAILKRGKILAYLALCAVIVTAMFAGYTCLADFLSQVTGFDGTTVGWMLMGFGGLGLVGNWVAGRIVDRGRCSPRFSRPDC